MRATAQQAKNLQEQRFEALTERYRTGKEISPAEARELARMGVIPSSTATITAPSNAVVEPLPMPQATTFWKPGQGLGVSDAKRVQREILPAFLTKRQEGVVEFLEANITLPPIMAPLSHGPFSTATRPYQRAILECWHPHSGINYCSVSAGVQIAKTTILSLGIAYRIAKAPLPILAVGTSTPWAKSELGEKRLHALIEANEILSRCKPSNLDLFRVMEMHMKGGVVKIVGGASPGALAGGTYGIVAIDEASKLRLKDSEQTPEAHPLNLALRRTDAYGSLAFHYLSSTPNSAAHPFWAHVEEGSQTHFWVECPHCRESFFMDMIGTSDDLLEVSEQLGIELPSDYKSMTWDQSARAADGTWREDKVRLSARYICPRNGCEITDGQRLGMVMGCQSIDHNKEASKHRKSFIIPSFYSLSFGSMAKAFLDAVDTGPGGERKEGGLLDYYTNRLARPYTTVKLGTYENSVIKMCGDYPRGTIPSDPKFVVIGCDPGEYATHWLVSAIMPDDSLAVIDWGTVLTVDELHNAEFRKARSYPIAGTNRRKAPDFGLVDSSYTPNRIYDLCSRKPPSSAPPFPLLPSRGEGMKGSTIYTSKKLISHPGLSLFLYSDHHAKTELYGMRMAKNQPPPIHLPKDAEEIKQGDAKGLIAGLSGQKLVMLEDREAWMRRPHDHYGDCLKIGGIVGGWICGDSMSQGERTT